MRERLHLQPGYTADRAHLRRPVTLADDMTLVALCESLERMEPRARAALFDEFSYYGSPEARDCERAELLHEDEVLEGGDRIVLRRPPEDRDSRAWERFGIIAYGRGLRQVFRRMMAACTTDQGSS